MGKSKEAKVEPQVAEEPIKPDVVESHSPERKEEENDIVSNKSSVKSVRSTEEGRAAS